MTSDSHSTTDDFFDIAVRLNLLEGDLDAIRRDFAETGGSPAEFLARRGLLDPVGIDIVETLRRPTEAIPGYEVLDVLGRGAMGVVYRAKQRNLDRVVALKTILVSQMSANSALERFELEGRTIGKLRHPNIVAAYDLGRNAGRLFLAMEFVEGVDLEQRLRREGPMDETIAWHLMRQAAAGLDHAAREGVVHRDVKPANLMLVAPPIGFPFPPGVSMVKIADFGLALLADAEPSTRLTTENTTVGSPYYMAPEQFETSQVDHVADIYAIGATIYHALAGRPPFAGMQVAQVIGAKLNGAPEPLESKRPGLSRMTYQLVERLMARYPTDRPPTYTAVVEEIDNVIGAGPGTGLPAAPPDANAATMIGFPTDNGLSTASQQAAATDFVEVTPSEAAVEAPAPATDDAVPSNLDDEPPTAPLDWKAGGDTGRETLVESAVDTDATEESTTEDRPAGTTPLPRKGIDVRWWIGGGACVALLLVLAVWRPWSGDPTPAPTPLEPAAMKLVAGSHHLFNGQNTSGWRRRHGNWVVPPDQAAILAGSDGTIGRPLFRSEGVPLRWYRLELVLQPREDDHTGVQELHFGIRGEPDQNGPRHVIRRTDDGLWLGTREADDEAFQPADGESVLVTVSPGDRVRLVLERNPNGWFLTHRDKRIAAVPLAKQELPEFRLLAENGTAWFSDFVVSEYEPAE